MKEEKKEKIEKKDKAIIILDKGINTEDGPEFVCCAYMFTPFRW